MSSYEASINALIPVAEKLASDECSYFDYEERTYNDKNRGSITYNHYSYTESFHKHMNNLAKAAGLR